MTILNTSQGGTPRIVQGDGSAQIYLNGYRSTSQGSTYVLYGSSTSSGAGSAASNLIFDYQDNTYLTASDESDSYRAGLVGAARSLTALYRRKVVAVLRPDAEVLQ